MGVDADLRASPRYYWRSAFGEPRAIGRQHGLFMSGLRAPPCGSRTRPPSRDFGSFAMFEAIHDCRSPNWKQLQGVSSLQNMSRRLIFNNLSTDLSTGHEGAWDGAG